MPYSPLDLESFVRKRAPEIAADILAAAQRSHNEADLVAEVEDVLNKFAKNFDVQLHLERERTLINGRADAVYNRFVIEYEPPRSLQKTNTARTNKHAIEQVQQYMGGLERLDRQRKERLAGAVLDGGFFIFVRFRDGHWHIDDPLPVNAHSTETFLRYLLSLSTELALTPENLVRDFGENSNTARQVVPALYAALTAGIKRAEKEPFCRKVRVLFQQWQHQFREVSGYDPQGGQLDPAELARLYAVRDRSPDLELLFFTIHTYYAAFIKLLALQIVHFYLMPKVGTGLSAAANYDHERLAKWLADLERGGLFAQLGIRNFLEGDFFGWYLDIWDEALETALKRLIGDLANYSLVTLDIDPEETRDLLKQLYQNLMPRKLRHALGEYYTPDWLADRLLNQLGYDGNPSTRILDPACGSGTFPVLAIKRARKYIDDKLLPPGPSLEKILENIVGFDLNPLAVISARTNYLLALGDLLESRQGEITIPIYLADSILTPSEEIGQLNFLSVDGSSKAHQPAYSFSTAVGRFRIPRSLVQAHYIDQLADLLEECVYAELSNDQFQARMLNTFPLDRQKDAAEIGVAVTLYEQLINLEQQGINGIWARIIKNAFAPLFQGKFDYVMGNPPWVNWENLPQDYRQEVAPLWAKHKLFEHKGLNAILGQSKDDISVLMTYISIDQYLKDKGKLGFLITQSVFKSAGGGKGFRRFQLGNGTHLHVDAVDDMVNLKPFEGASNRTAIILLEKGRKTNYPVVYNSWYRPDGGTIIDEDLSLSEIVVQRFATYRQFVAQPVDEDDPTSPWITGKRKALQSISKVLGKSDYKARAGVCTWLNGVYWLEIIDKRPDGLLVVHNMPDVGKRKIDSVQVEIEGNIIYPLLREGDVKRWHAYPQKLIILPHEKGMGLKAIQEDDMAIRLPKTFTYLKYFKDILRSRSGYKRYFKDTDPFYSVFNIGNYTFSSFKVVWSRVDSHMSASVITEENDKPIIPQETVTMVPVEDQDEAHYICAALNSSPFNYSVQSYSMKGSKSFGTPSILENVRIPKYDQNNNIHKKLSSLSLQAHVATSAGKVSLVQSIESEIDFLAAQFWGLTDVELKEIQESLKELE